MCQVGQEAGNFSFGLEGQGLKLLLEACQRGRLLQLNLEVRFQAFAMRDAKVIPRVNVARQQTDFLKRGVTVCSCDCTGQV
ncbi:hypothetical protein D3C77_613670 [compost metagenome]